MVDMMDKPFEIDTQAAAPTMQLCWEIPQFGTIVVRFAVNTVRYCLYLCL